MTTEKMVGGIATMGPFRWLTVAPKRQSDFELILKSTPVMDEATAACGGLAQEAVEMLTVCFVSRGSAGPGLHRALLDLVRER